MFFLCGSLCFLCVSQCKKKELTQSLTEEAQSYTELKNRTNPL